VVTVGRAGEVASIAHAFFGWEATRPEVVRWWRFLRVELSICARNQTAADESFLTIHKQSLSAQAFACSERQSSRATRRALAGPFRPCFAGESQPVFCRTACCCVGEKTTKCLADKTRAGSPVSPLFCGLCTAGMGGERTTKCLTGVRRLVARERLARTRRFGYSRTRFVNAEARVAKRRSKSRAFRLKTHSQQQRERAKRHRRWRNLRDGLGGRHRSSTRTCHSQWKWVHTTGSRAFFLFFICLGSLWAGLGWAGS